jgi:hypothetical protein
MDISSFWTISRSLVSTLAQAQCDRLVERTFPRSIPVKQLDRSIRHLNLNQDDRNDHRLANNAESTLSTTICYATIPLDR